MQWWLLRLAWAVGRVSTHLWWKSEKLPALSLGWGHPSPQLRTESKMENLASQL